MLATTHTNARINHHLVHQFVIMPGIVESKRIPVNSMTLPLREQTLFHGIIFLTVFESVDHLITKQLFEDRLFSFRESYIFPLDDHL